MPQALTAAAAGFGTGLSLIVAIGAQNAFVLRQGVRRAAVLPVVAICALSDAALIALGVGGVGALVVAWPGVVTAVGWIGGAFLLCYGALAARRVVRPQGALVAEGEATGSVKRAVLTCLALTWLTAVGLDRSTPYRGIAVVDITTADALASHDVAVYRTNGRRVSAR